MIYGDDQSSSNRSDWGLSLLGADAEPWADEAICAQTDPDAFFPEKGGSTKEAKRICQGCPVREDCLNYAIEHDERFGIWGGHSERERRAIKRGKPTGRVHRDCGHCSGAIKQRGNWHYCSESCRVAAKERRAS